MLNIVLNIVGITLVLYSIFIIKKDITMKQDNIEDIIDNDFFENEILNQEYYGSKEEKVEDFDIIMDNKIKLSELEVNQAKDEIKPYETYKNTIPIIKERRASTTDDEINPLHKKVIELESIGLSNEEIAKKMGKGIREVDIILKLYKKHL